MDNELSVEQGQVLKSALSELDNLQVMEDCEMENELSEEQVQILRLAFKMLYSVVENVDMLQLSNGDWIDSNSIFYTKEKIEQTFNVDFGD